MIAATFEFLVEKGFHPLFHEKPITDLYGNVVSNAPLSFITDMAYYEICEIIGKRSGCEVRLFDWLPSNKWDLPMDLTSRSANGLILNCCAKAYGYPLLETSAEEIKSFIMDDPNSFDELHEYLMRGVNPDGHLRLTK